MEYTKVTISAITNDKIELLIALLSEEGFVGFEESGDSMDGYISSAEFNPEKFKLITDSIGVSYSTCIIKETNWNELWESNFQPVIIYDPNNHKPFAHIRAGFHKPPESDLHDIIITPKMSFGTGHHPTTTLMIEQMSQLNLLSKKVLDFGTGTGVLAILAEKCGASEVIAVDNDNWSIANAAENIKANRCSHIALELADNLREDIDADLILANINYNIIIDNLHGIKKACRKHGQILFSGMLTTDIEKIHGDLLNAGFVIVDTVSRDGWIAILATC
jgi:ribosomal protein L11 methyltransferase